MTLLCKVTFCIYFCIWQLLCTIAINSYCMTIAIDYFCIQWWNYRQLLHEHIFSTIDSLSCTVRLMTFVCTIANLQPFFGLLQLNHCNQKIFYVAKATSKSPVALFITTYITLKQHYCFYTTCYGLILLLVELLSQPKIQNIIKELSKI